MVTKRKVYIIVMRGYIMERDEDIGRAYGFFSSDAPEREINSYLPEACKYVSAKSELELSLIESVSDSRGDVELVAIAKEAEQKGNNYVLQAEYPGGTNKDAANDLADVSNYLHGALQDKNIYFEKIVYAENGTYCSR